MRTQVRCNASSRLLVLSAISLITIALAAGCAGDDEPQTEPKANATPVAAIDVLLENWAIVPSSSALAAGTVTFTAIHEASHDAHGNAGGVTHQLLVARLDDDAKAGKSAFGSIVLNLSDIKTGETRVGTADLAAGRYELACLVVEEVDGKAVNHYEKGMYTTVVVR